MKIYFYIGIALVCLTGVFYFYRFAYHQGLRDCRSDYQQKMIQTVLKSQQDYRQITEKMKHLQQKLTEKKSHDETCRHILDFDVRQCL